MSPRLLVIISFLFSASASASDYYIGLNFGLSSQDVSLDVIDNTLNPALNINYIKSYRVPDETASSPSIVLGYRLGQDTALEISFSRVAEITTDFQVLDDNDPATNYLASERMESKSVSMALVGFWPVYEHWALHGKLGVSSWRFDFAQQVVEDVTFDLKWTDAMSDSGMNIFYGLGVSYGLNPALEITLGIDFHSYNPDFVNINVKHDMSVLALGARLHF
ncbi:MAG: hypothetical protein OEY89_18855 [Gammaproteobacteria bacterium]|nr:hypothetical protein [Gammaproteobacteria bacterium]